MFSDKEKSQYPNPQDYNNLEELTIRYTYARGGTELLRSVIDQLRYLDTQIEKLRIKDSGIRPEKWGKI